MKSSGRMCSCRGGAGQDGGGDERDLLLAADFTTVVSSSAHTGIMSQSL